MYIAFYQIFLKYGKTVIKRLHGKGAKSGRFIPTIASLGGRYSKQKAQCLERYPRHKFNRKKAAVGKMQEVSSSFLWRIGFVASSTPCAALFRETPLWI